MTITTRRARVLHLAYACSPWKGSEPGVGWNRAVEAAKYSDVWVITEGNEFKHQVLGHLSEGGDIPGLNFIFVGKTDFEERLSRLPGCYYVAYNLWHRRAYRVAKELHAELDFDLVHQVNMCGYREPGYLWKLNVPFIWGPIGGVQNCPTRLLPQIAFRESTSEIVRAAINGLQLRFSRRVRKAATRARVMLVANQAIQSEFEAVVGCETESMCEIGTRQIAAQRDQTDSTQPLRVLWAGECRERKGMAMFLKAVAALPNGVEVKVRVLGEGPARKRWEKRTEQLGIAHRFEWMGWLPHAEALQQYSWADILAFTSLRDTTGTVVLEALSTGVPVVSWNHQGVGDIVTDSSGIKIDLANPDVMIGQLRDALVNLSRDRGLLKRLSDGALERATDYLWRHQGERMRDHYRAAIGDGFDWTNRRTTDQTDDAHNLPQPQEVTQ